MSQDMLTADMNRNRMLAQIAQNINAVPKLPSYSASSLPSNQPIGSMIYVPDEAIGAVTAFFDGVNWRRTTDREVIGYEGLTSVASATSIDLDAATGAPIDITGTTNISTIALATGKTRTVRFEGALTLAHGSNLVLPGAANITTAAGDFAMFRGYPAGVVRCVFFSKYSGFPVVEPKRMMDITLYRSTQTALVGPTAASWDWPGTGVTASLYQFYANQLNAYPLSLAQWRAVWDPNVTGPATTGIRLVTADSGPANITAIATLTASGVGSVRNDATDITSDLNSLISAGTYKQIGHQLIGDGSSAAANVYSSVLEIIW